MVQGRRGLVGAGQRRLRVHRRRFQDRQRAASSRSSPSSACRRVSSTRPSTRATRAARSPTWRCTEACSSIAGAFTQRLKTLDPDTGKQLPYMSNVITGKLPNSNALQVFKFDISPDGQHLVAVGNFLQVNGVDRPRMFMLDLGATSATLSPWNYPPNGVPCSSSRVNAQMYIQDVDFAPDSSWFAVAAFGFQFQTNWNGQNYYGRQLCDSVSRFETNNLSPQRPSWINYSGGDSLKSVAATNTAVYVQGHSRWLDNPVVTNGVTNPKNGNPQPGSYPFDRCGTGCVDRLGGGAVDPNTGVALTWNPVMPQQSGGYKILPTANGVWFATDGSTLRPRVPLRHPVRAAAVTEQATSRSARAPREPGPIRCPRYVVPHGVPGRRRPPPDGAQLLGRAGGSRCRRTDPEQRPARAQRRLQPGLGIPAARRSGRDRALLGVHHRAGGPAGQLAVRHAPRARPRRRALKQGRLPRPVRRAGQGLDRPRREPLAGALLGHRHRDGGSAHAADRHRRGTGRVLLRRAP